MSRAPRDVRRVVDDVRPEVALPGGEPPRESVNTATPIPPIRPASRGGNGGRRSATPREGSVPLDDADGPAYWQAQLADRDLALETVQRNYDNLSAMCKRDRDELVQRELELQAAQRKIVAYEEDARVTKELSDAFAALRLRYDEFVKKYQASEKQLLEESTTRTTIEGQLVVAQKAAEDTRRMLERRDKAFAALEVRAQHAETSLSSVQDQLKTQTMNMELQNSEIKRLEGKATLLQSQLDTLEVDRGRINSAADEASEARSALNLEIGELQAQLTDAQLKAHKSAEREAEAKAEVTRLLGRLQAIERAANQDVTDAEENSALMAENERLKMELTTALSEKTAALNAVASMRAREGRDTAAKVAAAVEKTKADYEARMERERKQREEEGYTRSAPEPAPAAPAVDTAKLQAERDEMAARMAALQQREKYIGTVLDKLLVAEEATESCLTCMECMSIMENAVTLAPCGHSFCGKCVTGNSCPECMNPVTARVKAEALDTICSKFTFQKQTLSALVAKTRSRERPSAAAAME